VAPAGKQARIDHQGRHTVTAQHGSSCVRLSSGLVVVVRSTTCMAQRLVANPCQYMVQGPVCVCMGKTPNHALAEAYNLFHHYTAMCLA